VVYLSLNRLLFISKSVHYSDTHQKRLFHVACASVAFCIAIVFYGFVSVPLSSHYSFFHSNFTGCEVFDCIAAMDGSLVFYTAVKTVNGGLNFVTGLMLIWRIWAMEKRVGITMHCDANGCRPSEFKRKANVIAIVAVCAEFFFNFFPQLIVMVLAELIPSLMVSDYAGPYNVFSNSFDSLLSSYTYRKILLKPKKKESKAATSKVTRVAVMFKSRMKAIVGAGDGNGAPTTSQPQQSSLHQHSNGNTNAIPSARPSRREMTSIMPSSNNKISKSAMP